MPRTLLSIMLVLMCSSSPAETIRIPIDQQGGGQLATPSPGDTKGKVLDAFGLADEEHSPVGSPPITRWDYRYFSVYFENDRVINSVTHHQRIAPSQRDTRQ